MRSSFDLKVALQMKLAYALLLLAVVAGGAEPPWHWIKVSSNAAHEWDVSKGRAEVEIKGGRIEARLFGEDRPQRVKITLAGSVANGAVMVKEVVHESDFSGSSYTGRLVVMKWPKPFADSVGVQSVTLSDGLGMIAITRGIAK